MTLAHFGYGKNGEVLDDSELPKALTEVWTEDEANQGRRFPSYARLLSLRGTTEGESRFSWTVNFAARRKQAREDMKPFLANAEAAKAAAVSLKEKLKALKAANPKDGKIEVLEKQIWEQEKVAREAQAKANAIDAAVFDLKAVNPNAVVKIDARTPEEVIQSIEKQNEVVRNSLQNLRCLLQQGVGSSKRGVTTSSEWPVVLPINPRILTQKGQPKFST